MSLFMFALSCPRQREKEKKTRGRKKEVTCPQQFISLRVSTCVIGVKDLG